MQDAGSLLEVQKHHRMVTTQAAHEPIAFKLQRQVKIAILSGAVSGLHTHTHYEHIGAHIPHEKITGDDTPCVWAHERSYVYTGTCSIHKRLEQSKGSRIWKGISPHFWQSRWG